MSEAIRLEIVSYAEVVFDGVLLTLDAAQDFHVWWANNPALPQGGATFMRADKPYLWREAHPLERAKLTKTQERLIQGRLNVN